MYITSRRRTACTARFATRAIYEIPDCKLNQVAPATQAGVYTAEGPSSVLYVLYHLCITFCSAQNVLYIMCTTTLSSPFFSDILYRSVKYSKQSRGLDIIFFFTKLFN